MVASQNICAICYESMRTTRGKPLLTAECSHIFHLNCIATRVHNGNHNCPVCHSSWSDLPSQVLPFPNTSTESTLEFADDEPLLPQPENPTPPEQGPSQVDAGIITVKALPEYPALSQSEQADSFAVLVGFRAPYLSPEATDTPGARAPIDLVAVLDVSGSMHGDKMKLLKQAVNFVVENLGSSDRFSIVTFSDNAERVTRLKRMTDNGRSETAKAVNSLRAGGCTNIIAGLWKAVQILEHRREKNSVASIILLSDGQDNQNPPHGEGFYTALNQLPVCIRSRNMNQMMSLNNHVGPVPVHTFGFGSDHDDRALHAIADGSGGSFSFIETIEVIQDAFAQCLGGLLSVVSKDVKIHVQSCSVDVGILSISSGRYQNTIRDNIRPQRGLIEIGDLYAEEMKQFLVYLSVPQDMSPSTKLLEVKCSHKNPLSNDNTEIESETKVVEIKRCPSEELTEEDRKVCLEVDREKVQVLVTEGIAQAQVMAETGEFANACLLLDERRKTLLSSDSAKAGDPICEWLDYELKEIRDQMKNKASYSGGGRAYALATKCSLMYQRPATRMTARMSTGGAAPILKLSTGAAAPTACMKRMVKKSQSQRKATNKKDNNSSK